jgi:hypothetical protein
VSTLYKLKGEKMKSLKYLFLLALVLIISGCGVSSSSQTDMMYYLDDVNNPTENNKFQQWLESSLKDENFKPKISMKEWNR